MKIRDIHFFAFSIPGIGSTSKSSWTRTTHYFVAITTDSGLTGLGEGTPYKRGLIPNLIILKKLKNSLKHLDIQKAQNCLTNLQLELEKKSYFDYGVFMAIDSALIDLKSKIEEKPPIMIMGGKSRSAVSVCGTIFLGTNQEFNDRLKYWLEKGVKSFKIKISGSLWDIDRIAAIKEKVEDNVEIRVDANGGFGNFDKSLVIFEKLQKLGVEQIEQPFPFRHFDWCRKLKKSTDMQVILDEDITSSAVIKKIAGCEYADAIHIHPSKFGCINITRQILDLIEDLGLQWSLGASGLTGIGTHMLLALLGTRPKLFFPAEEVGHFEQFGVDIVKNRFLIDKGKMKIPDEGIGWGAISHKDFVQCAKSIWSPKMSIFRYANYEIRSLLPNRLLHPANRILKASIYSSSD